MFRNLQAEFEEYVNATIFEILEQREDLDEFFFRKDQEDHYGKGEYDNSLGG